MSFIDTESMISLILFESILLWNGLCVYTQNPRCWVFATTGYQLTGQCFQSRKVLRSKRIKD